MDDPSIENILVVMVGGLLSLVYAILETGLSAFGDFQLKALAEEDDEKLARAASRLLRSRPVIMARLHIGLIASLCVTLTATIVGFGSETLMAAVTSTAVVSGGYLLIATIAKAWVVRRAGTGFLMVAHWLRLLEWLVFPVSVILTPLIEFVDRFVPERAEEDAERLTALRVEHAIDEGEEDGALEEDHADLLRSALDFENTKAHEVMVPRTSTVAIEIETPLEDVVKLVVESGHSRYPVFRSRIDQVEGILCAKDIFRVLGEGADMGSVNIADLVRKPVLFVRETKKIGLLFRDMQARGVHLAVVVNEFGGLSGVITLEDILEEIVGEIRDEHDGVTPSVVKLEPGRFMADAGLSISDLSESVGEDLIEIAEGYDSLGGWVSGVAGRVPPVGAEVQVGVFRLMVREANERRVLKVELWREAEVEPVEGSAS